MLLLDNYDLLWLEGSTRQVGDKAGGDTHAFIHIQSIGQKQLKLLGDELLLWRLGHCLPFALCSV